MTTMFRFLPVLVCFAACAGDDKDDSGNGDGNGNDPGADLTGWLGTTPHLRVVGTIVGNDLDIDVTGEDAASLGTLFCERNYLKDNSIEKVEIKHNFTFSDLPSELEISVESSTNIGAYTVGTDAVVELQIESVDESIELETAATSGSVTVDEFTGKPDGDGVIPSNTGTYGGFVDLTLDDGATFKASYTANCGEND